MCLWKWIPTCVIPYRHVETHPWGRAGVLTALRSLAFLEGAVSGLQPSGPGTWNVIFSRIYPRLLPCPYSKCECLVLSQGSVRAGLAPRPDETCFLNVEQKCIHPWKLDFSCRGLLGQPFPGASLPGSCARSRGKEPARPHLHSKAERPVLAGNEWVVLDSLWEPKTGWSDRGKRAEGDLEKERSRSSQVQNY